MSKGRRRSHLIGQGSLVRKQFRKVGGVMTLTPEQRERIINFLAMNTHNALRGRTDEELMEILQVGEALREEIDPEYRALRNKG